MTIKQLVAGVVVFILILIGSPSIFPKTDLPVKSPVSKGYKVEKYFSIDCFLTLETLQACIKDGDEFGLVMDFSGIEELLDGTEIKPGDMFGGTVYLGPYPFEQEETSYSYKRFRSTISFSKNRIILPVGNFLAGYRNSEDWTNRGMLALRLELYLDNGKSVRYLGLYDTFLRFQAVAAEDGKVNYIKKTTLIDGPSVNLITSDDPSTLVIAFKTDAPAMGTVTLKDGRQFKETEASTRHEIKVTGLKPGSSYAYRVEFEDYTTRFYSFQTAPIRGEGDVMFAYSGDSRAGTGGGANNLMGVNYLTMERLANLAYNKGAQLFVFGGDLINGYTSSPEDFATQMMGWKQAVAGFRNHRPVYSCLGNHEALLRAFKGTSDRHLVMDRWPYETESAEALFARELVLPENGPTPSDPRRPSYKENVYSFQYGPIRFISFNNNYWVTRNLEKREGSWRTGGAPEGYILPDQMQWIQKELDKAEQDSSVKYIIMFAQEPVFPNGGHVQDSMWYNGSNTVRAYTLNKKTGKLEKEAKGILEVRNRLIQMISNNKKVAAVLGADEHAYHKVLIDKDVPIGVPAIDDNDGSGRVCKEDGTCSPLDTLKYPTWYLVCGGAGAPYYSKEPTPWNRYWEAYTGNYPNHSSLKGPFYYSSQENMFLFATKNGKLSMTVCNPYGEVIDRIDDMMKVKLNAGE
jgi:hypothetical protein